MERKYTITIEETVSEEFEVYAESPEEALEQAKQEYYEGEFVLEPGNLVCKQMAITFPNEEATEWYEF